MDQDHMRDVTEVLKRRLPMRALQSLRKQKEIYEGELALYEIDDHNIDKRLRDEGIDVDHIIENAIHNIIANVSYDCVDLFGAVDPAMRGEANPLLRHVRGLIHRYRGY